jgi:hypothetical protein
MTACKHVLHELLLFNGLLLYKVPQVCNVGIQIQLASLLDLSIELWIIELVDLLMTGRSINWTYPSSNGANTEYFCYRRLGKLTVKC